MIGYSVSRADLEQLVEGESEFFQLDNVSRKNLIRERAMVIIALFPALKALATNAKDALAGSILAGLTAAHSPHTNCARSFHRLFQSDPADAREIFERAAALLSSTS